MLILGSVEGHPSFMCFFLNESLAVKLSAVKLTQSLAVKLSAVKLT